MDLRKVNQNVTLEAPNGYICTGDAWFGYCLPYNEETAKLIGTTKDMEV